MAENRRGARTRALHTPPPGSTVTRSALLTNGSDREFRQLVHNMLAFGVDIQEIRNRLAATIGLSGIQYTILVAIAHLRSQGDIGINQIAAHLHLSGAFVTIEVNKLVDAGLVKKQTNLEDRRRVMLTLAAKGTNLLDRLRSIQRPVNDTLFDSISPGEFELLCRVMGIMVENGGRALRLLDYLAEVPQHKASIA